MTVAAGSIHCPACKQRLVPVPIGRMTIDVCKLGCKGIWFDAQELQALAQPSERLLAVLAEMLNAPRRFRSPVPLQCPRCAKSMSLQLFPGSDVTVDRCDGCAGFFLDAGELRPILGLPPDGSLPDLLPQSPAVTGAVPAAANPEPPPPPAVSSAAVELEPDRPPIRLSWGNNRDYKGPKWVAGPNAKKYVVGNNPNARRTPRFTTSWTDYVFMTLVGLAEILTYMSCSRHRHCCHRSHCPPKSLTRKSWDWFT